MEEARTIAGLSPVARIESPRPVPKNQRRRKATKSTIRRSRRTVPHSRSTGCSPENKVKTVSVPKIDRLEENPMTARLMVYNPVLTIIPDKILSIPRVVCKKAVQNPDREPESIAIKIPRIGCPAIVKTAETAVPRVKEPSVDRSAIFKIL